MITFQQFMEIDLRTAVVTAASRVPDTDKLLQLTVEVGGEERTLVAGVAEVYEPDALVGKHIVIVANLEPATIRGVRSEGMILAADVDRGPIVVTVDDDVPSGKRVR